MLLNSCDAHLLARGVTMLPIDVLAGSIDFLNLVDNFSIVAGPSGNSGHHVTLNQIFLQLH